MTGGAGAVHGDERFKQGRWTRALDHAFVLARRGVLDLVRVPAAFLPSLLLPLFFFVVYSAGIGPLAQGNAAVAGNYRGFILATILLLSLTNSASAAGFAVVRDIESGYFDKLLLTPVNRLVLIVGRLLADGLRAMVQTSIILLVGLATNTGLAAGPGGFALIVVLGMGWAVAWSGVGLTIALRTGSLDATQFAFFVGFPFVFLSPAFGPRELLGGWLATASRYNPVTYLIEAVRSLILDGWDGAVLARAATAIVLVAAVTLTLATRALRSRARATS